MEKDEKGDNGPSSDVLQVKSNPLCNAGFTSLLHYSELMTKQLDLYLA